MVERLLTVRDFRHWANSEKIPVNLYVQTGVINLMYFKRHEERIHSVLYDYLPLNIQVNHWIVPDEVGSTYTELLKYTAPVRLSKIYIHEEEQ